MSKCDLHIQLDRRDGKYLGGQEVTGELTVRVNKDVNCNALTVQQHWKTHGRGNTDSGGEFTLNLYSGPLAAGTVHRHRFTFTAPAAPLTYHGHYLNIDHYISARVDIPWAIDPKASEEYLVLPGGQGGEDQTPHEQRVMGFGDSIKKMGKGAMIAAIVCIAIGVFTFPCGIPLILIGLGLLFFSMRNKLAEKKVGEVMLQVGTTTVVPKQSVPVSLIFTPPGTVKLNQIALTLTGKEQCVSGSGTNRTTHTHKLLEHETQLAGSGVIEPHERAVFGTAVKMPDTAAYSFSASDNKIIWGFSVRIDIPWWPDWVHSQELWMVPGDSDAIILKAVDSHALPAPQEAEGDFDSTPRAPDVDRAPEIESHIPQIETQSSWAGAEASVDAPQQPMMSAYEPDPSQVPELEAPTFETPTMDSSLVDVPMTAAPPPSPTEPAGSSAVGTLHEVIDAILGADRFGGERDKLVEGLVDQPFQFDLEVEQVDWTLGSGLDKKFRNGRTIVGKIPDTSRTVAVLFDESLNDQIEILGTGAQLRVGGAFSKWDDFYERPQILADRMET